MPEYLAPGVYVEEIDTGNQPIEGVSTSTAGMLGVTERGPANVPILITGTGEYNRWFGGELNILDYSDPVSGYHCYLPHAVEGFFTNGGKRAYITRIVDTDLATRAQSFLFNRDMNPAGANTVLLRSMGEDTGTAANPPLLLVLPDANLAQNGWIRIGDGSAAEYRQIASNPVDFTLTAPLNLPLSRAHAAAGAAVPIEEHTLANLLHKFTLVSPIAPARLPSGEQTIQISTQTSADLDDLIQKALASVPDLEIQDSSATGTNEFRTAKQIQRLSPNNAQILLDSPLLFSYADGSTVNHYNLDSTSLVSQSQDQLDALSGLAGDSLLIVKTIQFQESANVVVIDPDNDREVRRIGQLGQLTLNLPISQTYPGNTLVQSVSLTDENAPPPRNLTTPIMAGTNYITLDNRSGLLEGSVIRIGPTLNPEYQTIKSLPNRAPTGADAGKVVLTSTLVQDYPTIGTQIVRQNPAVLDPSLNPSVLVLDATQGTNKILVSDANSGNYVTKTLCLTTPSQAVFYNLATNSILITPQSLSLTETLRRSHPRNSPVIGRQPLFNVIALDAGAWGNRLRISITDEVSGLVSTTKLVQVISATKIRLASSAGAEPGTVLEFLSATGTTVDNPVKVATVNRATGEILLDTPLSAAQQSPGLTARSREFVLTVNLLRQPDVLVPARNETVLDSEVFRYLSMDPRHSHYIQTIIGATWDDIPGTKLDKSGRPLRLSDRRSEGQSNYIRVCDWALLDPGLTTDAARQTAQNQVRLRPETLVDVLANGQQRPARLQLDETLGDDSISTLNDDIYIGADDPTPENRTGLNALKNIDEISIITCPGRNSAAMQSALIDQCELMRYRFAVLDGPRPPDDALTDVQLQRQQFDTKYAALYHPWLLIPDPYPASTTNIALYPIPPSGHVVGVYARTDIERGVHKAPANELVQGITGLQRVLNKEEQDILNPYPVNINVIRDFRNNDRGIRVYGGRVITSDSDWKYVNVRRLLIFIEASIDRGLQWAVFEPNAEALWLRVRRSISNFLTSVWRSGGLEGTKPEEAYFVKCDRTTMTQTDIDNGRLIVIIGVAPVKPAEYVIIRIGLWTANADV